MPATVTALPKSTFSINLLPPVGYLTGVLISYYHSVGRKGFFGKACTFGVMQALDDSTLVELLRESSYPAFDEIHARYWKYVYTIAYRKTGDKDQSFDLCQAVFIDLFQKREQLELKLPLKNYLRTAILYKIAGFFRTRGFEEKHYRNFKAFLEQHAAAESTVNPFESEDADIGFEELLTIVYNIVEEMPERMKEIFLLSREEKQSITEIAERLQISPQTVKNQLSLSYKRIRETAFKQGLRNAELSFVVWIICS